MDLLKKLIPVVLVLAVVVGVFLWCMSADDIKLEPEEIPLGLEWGMTREEVIETLENAGCYPENDGFFYYGHSYQGIAGADYWVWPMCEENGTLSSVNLYFSSKKGASSYAPIVSTEILEELDVAFDKAYSKNCKLRYDSKDETFKSRYYLHENVLAKKLKVQGGAVIVFAFYGRNIDCNKALIDEIIEKAKFL